MTGDELRALRHRAKLTQAELAARVSVHPVTVAKWEAAMRRISPLAETAIRSVLSAPTCAIIRSGPSQWRRERA